MIVSMNDIVFKALKGTWLAIFLMNLPMSCLAVSAAVVGCKAPGTLFKARHVDPASVTHATGRQDLRYHSHAANLNNVAWIPFFFTVVLGDKCFDLQDARSFSFFDLDLKR